MLKIRGTYHLLLHLAVLQRYLFILQLVFPRGHDAVVLLWSADLVLLLGGGCSAVWEQRFIYFEQGLLVIDEEIKQVALISRGEVADFDSVLG